MSVAPPEGDRNRLMIYGAKNGCTDIVEFKTTGAISILASETRVARYFQERMPYGRRWKRRLPVVN